MIKKIALTIAGLLVISSPILASAQAVGASASTLATLQIPATGAQSAISVTSGTCQSGSGWCLEVSQGSVAAKEIVVAPTGEMCNTSSMEETADSFLADIGTHGGGPLPQVSTLYCEPGTAQMRAALSVVDLNTDAVVGTALSPNTVVGGAYSGASFTDYPKDPSGNEYPFLAAGYGDTLNSGGTPIWGYMCLYKPGTTQTGQCGANFMQIAIAPFGTFAEPGNADYFREVGGYLQDLDGDGWDDISLLYESIVYTISGRTGQPLSTTVYDVAQGSNVTYLPNSPDSPEWFHGGRNYGIVVALPPQNGQTQTVLLDGVPVGSFSDAFCNVSRYVGVLSSSQSNPAGRSLAWSRYYGFADNSYGNANTYLASLANNPVVTRLGDMENGCIHLFGDGISTMGATPVVAFNYFTQTAPVDQCVVEQYSDYAPGSNGSEWNTCLDKNLQAKGVWGMQVLRLSDGTPLTASSQTYVWGMDDNLLPSHDPAYIVQILPAQEDFNLSDVPDATTPQLQVRELSATGSWIQDGTLPESGLVKINQVNPGGNIGEGSYTTLAQLVTRPDPDGLDDIEMADGTWVGYDATSNSFVVKSSTNPSPLVTTPTPPTVWQPSTAPDASTSLSGIQNYVSQLFASIQAAGSSSSSSASFVASLTNLVQLLEQVVAAQTTPSVTPVVTPVVQPTAQPTVQPTAQPTVTPVPAAPTNLSSSCNAAGSQITLNWNDSDTSITAYNLNISGGASPSSQAVTAAGSAMSKVVNVTPGTAYQWDVSAVNPAGTSGLSQTLSFTCQAPATPTPAPTSCTFNNQSVASGASVTAYQSSSVASGSSCVSQQRTCTSGTLSGSYTNGSCTVQAPTPVVAATPTDTSYSCTNTSGTQVKLSWSDADQSVTAYNLNVSGGPTPLSIAVQATPGVVSQLVTINAGTAYQWDVSAMNSVGTSPHTVTAGFTCQNTVPPATPSGLSSSCVAGSNGTQAKLMWNDSDTSITAYNLNISGGASPSSQAVTAAGSAMSKVVNVTPGTAYQWDVSAVNPAGTSGLSQTLSFTCQAPATPTPAPTSCTFNNQSVASGASVTAYQSSSVASGSSCVSQQRTCTSGTLSGSYTNGSCTVQAPTPVVAATPTDTSYSCTNTSGTQVKLSWSDADQSVTAYNLNVSGGPTPLSIAVQATPGVVSQLVTINAGTAYQWDVSAMNSVGTSPHTVTAGFTCQNTVPPATPSGLSSSCVAGSNGTQAKLMWNDSDTSITAYNLNISGGASPSSQAVTAAGSAMSKVVNVTPGTAYQWDVSAVNPAGTSGLSQTLSFTCQPTSPPSAAPTIISSSCNGSQATFTWSDPDPTVTVYSFNMSSAGGASSKAVPNTGNGTVTYSTSVTPGVAYEWDVSAFNAVGGGPLSPTPGFTCSASSAMANSSTQTAAAIESIKSILLQIENDLANI